MDTNALGLSRNIPADVKRQVRQRCGFGCVVCGAAIFQYDHMEKAFVDAECHEPDDITLLCGTDHQRKTGGSLSLESVKRANANPRCSQLGFSRGPFDIGPNFSELVIGTISCAHTDNIVTVFGDPILSISPPEVPGAPMRLNATLSDDQGVPVMQITDNEWITPATNWDVFVQGQTIAIRRGKRDIVLSIRVDPPNRLRIERLHMFHRGVRIDCDSGQHVQVTLASGLKLSTRGMQLNFCPACIEVDAEGVSVGPLRVDKHGARLDAEGSAIVQGFSVEALVIIPHDRRVATGDVNRVSGQGNRAVDFLLRRGAFSRPRRRQ